MTRGIRIEHIGNAAEKQRPCSINRIEFEILVPLATEFRICFCEVTANNRVKEIFEEVEQRITKNWNFMCRSIAVHISVDYTEMILIGVIRLLFCFVCVHDNRMLVLEDERVTPVYLISLLGSVSHYERSG
ncbi:pentatricopeptide repeat-containing protein chloroplastic [Dorcoceras hygrometricum]|uniref:Pentatricopeptide repeat-containing protein chloroplastic n=1 Tax=Dorcoceras hygrometricum TaxID=472368 RepID=A0A2Z7DCW0_9LAMI|nr:pentatricopeptide repeat-containing protein chloroplastic [Dorcoceras hygrometricum]